MEQIFGSSYLRTATNFSVGAIALSLVIGLAIGLAIFWVYKSTYKGVMYSSSFALSLIGMTLITVLVISAVSSNLIASLGMVGALSIVRFRTVVKEPLDLVYMFWAIAAGIVVGIGLFPLALLGSVFIGGMLWIFMSRRQDDIPYAIVLRTQNNQAMEAALQLVGQNSKKLLVKTRSDNSQSVELTAEIRLIEKNTVFLSQVSQIPGVENVSLVSFNGEYYM